MFPVEEPSCSTALPQQQKQLIQFFPLGHGSQIETETETGTGTGTEADIVIGGKGFGLQLKPSLGPRSGFASRFVMSTFTRSASKVQLPPVRKMPRALCSPPSLPAQLHCEPCKLAKCIARSLLCRAVLVPLARLARSLVYADLCNEI